MTVLEGVVPYPPEFAARYRAKGYWEDRSMAQFFDDICSRYTERLAFVAGEERITYGELAAKAERLALHLLKLGVQPLDRLVMQLPNVPEFIYLYLALQKVGAIPIMALASHRYTEISQFVRLGEAVGYAFSDHIGNDDLTALAERVQQENRSLRWLLVLGQAARPGLISLTDLLQTDPDLSREQLALQLTNATFVAGSAQVISKEWLANVTIDPTAPALLQLSGGTTGVPKLIPRTNNDYIYNTKAAVAVNDIHPDDALFVGLPIAHNFPLACPGIQGFMLQGARSVLSTSTRPADVFPLIERERITHVELVPAVLIR